MSDSASKSKPRKRRRRGDTRQALVDTAFDLLASDKSFDGLSLRELTREVGVVPTAFYRHFSGMDALGLALVDDAFRALRSILDEVRKDSLSTDQRIHGVVGATLEHVRTHEARFRFIGAERVGGNAGVRRAIRRELRLVYSELALELARFEQFRTWSARDLNMLASLLINSMVVFVEDMLDTSQSDMATEAEMTQTAEKQLRLIMLGVPNWTSAP